MRAALYYPWVYLKGGAERVLVELIGRSRHDWTLYTNHYEPESTFPELRQVSMVALPEVPVRRTLGSVAAAGLTLLTQRLDFDGQQALLVVSEGLGNLLAMRSRLPTSCICLTPLKVAYDELTREHFFAGGRRLHYRAALSAYQALERPTWRRYVRVFCNSFEVRRRLLRASLVDEARIEVAYHGVDAVRFRPAGRRETFFLVPGRIMWQKDVDLAIRAWRRFKPDPLAGPFRLVVAGMVDRKSAPYLDQLRRDAGGRPDVEFVISPTDDQLLSLYQRCHAVVFCARNEDWGLTVLEAMACGKPVLAANSGGPRESVLNGRTGFLLSHNDEAFAAGLQWLVGMPGAGLEAFSLRARERARMFPWERFVGRIDAHVDELAGVPGLPWLPDPGPQMATDLRARVLAGPVRTGPA